MGRLFTFGCSYTHYAWPTWADIIAVDRNLSLYNFAQAGLGNVGIHQRVLEADCKYNFTDDDTIMIMWTSWCREDMIKGMAHEAAGSIFSKYSIKHLRQNYSYADIIVKNSNAIIYTNKVYKDNIDYQGSAFPTDWIESGELSGDFLKEQEKIFVDGLKTMYSSAMPKIEKIKFKESGRQKSFDCLQDGHPDVLAHLNIVLQDIAKVSPSTIKLTTQMHYEIKNELKKSNCENIDEATPIIDKIIENSYPEFQKVKSQEYLSKGIV